MVKENKMNKRKNNANKDNPWGYTEKELKLIQKISDAHLAAIDKALMGYMKKHPEKFKK